MGALRQGVPLATVEDLAEKGRAHDCGTNFPWLSSAGSLALLDGGQTCESALREVKEFDVVVGLSRRTKQDVQRQLSLIKERGIKNKELMDIAFENARHSDLVANDCKYLEPRFLSSRANYLR